MPLVHQRSGKASVTSDDPGGGTRHRVAGARIVLALLCTVCAAAFTNACGVGSRAAADGLPVTFLIASDAHYGVSDSVGAFNRRIIQAMNDLPGTPYPDRLGGEVETPKALVLTGDLTEDGLPEEWEAFAADYGLLGEARLRYPVYEGFGNHDGPVDGPVRAGVRARNLERPGLRNVSGNGLHYSWGWGDLHFVHLNSYPSYEWDSGCEWCHYFTRSFREPEQSLQFLEEDLREWATEGRQVVLFFHYGFDDWGRVWWTDAERADFHEVIRESDVLAIFHGHSHDIQFTEWRGIPVFCVGSTQKETGPGEYMVVRVTGDSLFVAERRMSEWGGAVGLPRR